LEEASARQIGYLGSIPNARISAAGDGDVIEVIAGFATEVAVLPRDVLLALSR
jgi:hypothetical protein